MQNDQSLNIREYKRISDLKHKEIVNNLLKITNKVSTAMNLVEKD